MAKKVFKVGVTWTQTGYYYVKADSLKEAKEATYDLELPKDGEYLDDSFEVNDDDCEEVECFPEHKVVEV